MFLRVFIVATVIMEMAISIPTSKKETTDTELIMAHMLKPSRPESIIRVVERKRANSEGEMIERDKRRSPQRRIHKSKPKESSP